MNKEEFINEINKLNLEVTQEKLDMLEEYYNCLIEYNKHTNITAITEENDVYLKHFYDSLTLTKVIDFNLINTILDIGSGAGFPGVVIKIFFPHLKVTVLDSNGKKTKFIKSLIDHLSLIDIEVINARAEDYAFNHLNTYDVCVSRAVAFFDIICELSLPFIKTTGKVVLMKGDFTNEKRILTNYQHELNIKNYEIVKVTLPITNDERNLIILNKAKETTKILNYSQIVKRNKKWNQ